MQPRFGGYPAVKHRELTAHCAANLPQNRLWIDFFQQQSDNRRRSEVAITIHVEHNPEMERQLTAEALARGLALELYAQRFLQEAIASRGKGHARASQEEFRAFLNALASKAPNVPQLRTNPFSREMIYAEHA
jgi:hypothetical protein